MINYKLCCVILINIHPLLLLHVLILILIICYSSQTNANKYYYKMPLPAYIVDNLFIYLFIYLLFRVTCSDMCLIFNRALKTIIQSFFFFFYSTSHNEHTKFHIKHIQIYKSNPYITLHSILLCLKTQTS